MLRLPKAPVSVVVIVKAHVSSCLSTFALLLANSGFKKPVFKIV